MEPILKRLRRALILCYLVWLVGPAQAEIDWPQLRFTLVAEGAVGPTSIADPGDGSGRLFVTEQQGRVLLLKTNGVVPFLDLRDRVLYFPGGESGLLSVAFSPGFSSNRTFFVFYNSKVDGS